jgi:signal transduction histidine kinase/CHASE3 domain sensor protein
VRRLGHLSVAARVLLAAALFALVAGAGLLLLISAIERLRDAGEEAAASESVIATVNRYEKLVVDLETGHRGFVITGDERFLEPWERARRSLPEIGAELESQVRGDPELTRLAVSVRRRVRAYYNGWSLPIVRLARVDRERAQRRVATAEGTQQVNAIRGQLAELAVIEQGRAQQRSAAVDRETRRAVTYGLVMLAGLVLLALVVTLYFARAVTAPLHRLAGAARGLAGGDLAVRVPVEGGGEVSTLALTFNRMADALDEERKRLQTQNVELEAVLDASDDAICMADSSGRLLFANATMDRLWDDLGLLSEGSIWDRLAALAERTTDPEAALRAAAPLAEPSTTVTAGIDLVDGRSFHCFSAPVRYADARPFGRIFVLRDVTRERDAERAKEEFVANVSHELRTPLTSLAGFLDLVLEEGAGPLTADQDRYLAIARRSTDRLSRLVGDLLFVARADARPLDLDLEAVDLRSLLVDCAEEVRALATTKNIELEVDVDGPLELRADPARLSQLVHNLVGNALKFTPDGGRVSLRGRSSGDDVVVEVSDTGIGMSDEDLAHVFERFFRTQQASSSAIAGTGLGLPIAKAIAEAHGGTVEVESEVGAGTTFRVRLPLY